MIKIKCGNVVFSFTGPNAGKNADKKRKELGLPVRAKDVKQEGGLDARNK